MPKGKFENDYASTWTGLLIGQSVTFSNVHRGAVITSFDQWCRVRNLNWKCTTVSEGDKGGGEPARRVTLTRIDPDQRVPSEAETLATLNKPPKCFWEVNTRTHRFHINSDGLREREVWKAQKTRRSTLHNWELLDIGHIRVVRSKIHPLKHSIIKACYIRDLDRRFLARKVIDPMRRGDTADWFRVERVDFDLKCLPMPDHFLLADDR